MDGAKTGLLVLVLACVGAGALVLAAADKKNESERKKTNFKPGTPSENTAESDSKKPMSTLKSAADAADAADDPEKHIHAAQSRLGIPPPGEKRIEAVAPRTIGGIKR